MERRDFILIPVAAIAVMVLNVAISFGLVWLYSTFLNPGQPPSHYEDFAMRSAPVSSVIAGIPLMLLAGFVMAKGRPARSALLAAGGVALVYIALDTTILVAAGAGQELWTWAALSHATKLLAALAGAKVRTGRTARVPGH